MSEFVLRPGDSLAVDSLCLAVPRVSAVADLFPPMVARPGLYGPAWPSVVFYRSGDFVAVSAFRCGKVACEILVASGVPLVLEEFVAANFNLKISGVFPAARFDFALGVLVGRRYCVSVCEALSPACAAAVGRGGEVCFA